MKNFIFSFVGVLLLTNFTLGQSNDCSTATTIAVTANCSSPVNGTTTGATQSIPGCSGTADDDVWYKFTATATSHQINVVSSASFDAVVQLFSGTCATLNSITCQDLTFTAGTETINAYGLVIGNIYSIRVYDYYVGSGSGAFTICVTNAPTPPANDNCSGAITLAVNASCIVTNFSTNGATQSSPGCAGNADDDVWFKFVATNAVQTITVTPTGSLDPVVQLYSGTCAGLSSLYCIDNTLSGQSETINGVGLVPGNTYFIRAHDYYGSTTGSMSICVVGTATSAPTNDNPCTAITLPPVTATCTFSQFTTVGATATGGVPNPASCIGGGGAAMGGWSASSKDVWFAITVPSSGKVHITAKPNMGPGSISDGVMALYSGTCGALTQIVCSDDNNYPGGANDLLPLITASGLTPGSTVYLRYWGFGSVQGTFGICVTTATNDNCANALYICDINGYSGATSGAYTPDRPGNMRGNNEDISGVNQPDGINTGGIFGQGGSWGSGAPNYDVTIDNNSWIKFTAANTTATLNVSISDCWVGNYPSGGIQMQIFSGTNCTSFTPVSNFAENSTGFVLTANGLTIGNDYYLMIDGFAGDICNYTITANSGVLFPDITDVPPICQGQSVTLTAPPGATSYLWAHNNATTQSVIVTPSTSQTYYCDVTGLCDHKQTLDVLVTVKPNPTVSISAGAAISLCAGNSATLTASGATTYSWSSGPTTAAISVSPAVTTTFTVTGTTNGCTNTANTIVTVNPKPTLSVSPTSNPSNCSASTGSLTGAAASGAAPLGYVWTNASNVVVSNTANANSIPAGSYNLLVTDGNGCSQTFGPFTVTNPGSPAAPSINTISTTACAGGTISLGINSPDPSATYTWSGPNSFTSTSNTITFNNVATNIGGSYCVTSTLAGCTGSPSCQTVTVNPNPTVGINVGGATSICTGNSVNLIANGATTYSWSSGQATSNISVSPATTNTYTVTGTTNGCSNMTSTIVTVNSNPSLTTSPSSLPADCNGSNGSLSGTVINGAPTITYNWTNGMGTTISNTSNATGLTAGTYNLSVSDGNGCIASFGPFTVNNPPNPATPTLLTPQPTICEGFSSTINVNSPNPSNTYSWTGPNSYTNSGTSITLSSATTNMTGSYCVTAYANGCQSSAACTTITVNPNPTVSINVGAATSICAGNSTNLIANGATSYSWSSGQATANISVSPASTTTFTVTGTTNGCTNMSSTIVTVNSNPSLNTSPTSLPADCGGSNGSLSGTVVNGAPTITYNWTNTLGTTVSNTANATGLSAGNYNLSVSDGNGCVANFGPFTVTNPTSPPTPVTLVSQPTICAGSSTTINISSPDGSTTYDWTGPNSYVNTGTSITLSNATTNMSGNYCVTATQNACQSSPACSNITINPIPVVTIDLGANVSICNGNSTTLTAAGATTYSWSSGQNTTGINVSPTTNTTYTVTGDLNGCTAQANTMVTVNPNPIMNIVPTSTQSDCNASTGSLTGTVINGQPVIIYDWTNGIGTTVSTTADANNLSSGTYNLNVTDGNGCIATFGPFTISNVGAPTAPAINAISNSACEDGTIQLDITNPDVNATYDWTGPNGFTFTGTSISFTNATASLQGNYCVTTTISGCTSAPSCEMVTINSLPTIQLSAANNDTSICENTGTVLTAIGGTTYMWTAPNGNTSSGSTLAINNMNANDEGWYLINGTDGNLCSNNDSIYISFLSAPQPSVLSDAANDEFCKGGSATLIASGGTNYSWTGPNNFSSNAGSFTINPVTNSNTGLYIVTVSDTNGCNASDSITIKISQNSNANAASNDSIICPGEPVSFYGTGGGTYSWSGPLNLTTDQQNFTINFTTTANAGWYVLTVVDSSGCQSSDSTYLSIEPNSDCLLIPGLDTPNGDGKNDTWFIQGLEQYPNAEVEIYNRWGNLVYKAVPYKNDWAGEVNSGTTIDQNGKVPVGTYFYILQLKDSEDQVFKGTVEVEY